MRDGEQKREREMGRWKGKRKENGKKNKCIFAD
jgi:hypothetical protein